MANASYHAGRQPLVPGVQPQPLVPIGQNLPSAAQFSGSQRPQPSLEKFQGQAYNKLPHRRFQDVSAGGPQRRSGQRTIKVTSAPAAVLKLLDTVASGRHVAICKAPVNCRMISLEVPGALDHRPDRHEPMDFMIPTPTGSAAFDTMPSTPLEEFAGGMQGVIWPPRSAAEAAMHAPSGSHMASMYYSNGSQAAAMPVLRLSEVIPGQHLVHPYGSNVTTSVSGQADLPKAQLGSKELPSRGSALHAWRACKPCAFIFQDGCENKEECEFCHLCEPGERKRRKKDRKVQKREAAEQRVMQGVPQIWNAQR